MERQTHTIDAKGKVVGRLSTEIAILLRGKNRPEYVPHIDGGDFVIIKNAEKVKFTGKKSEQKRYYHHTGYLGGLKAIPVKKKLEKKPSDILWHAVYGMLPKNKLRSQQIKRLKFE